MKTFQLVRNQSLLTRTLFWIGEVIGIVFIIPLLLFVGANLVEELENGLITIKEEYVLFIFFFLLLGVAIGLTISWYRIKTGAWIVCVASVAASLTWGFNDSSMTLMLMPPMISGLLLNIIAYKATRWISG